MAPGLVDDGMPAPRAPASRMLASRARAQLRSGPDDEQAFDTLAVERWENEGGSLTPRSIPSQ